MTTTHTKSIARLNRELDAALNQAAVLSMAADRLADLYTETSSETILTEVNRLRGMENEMNAEAEDIMDQLVAAGYVPE